MGWIFAVGLWLTIVGVSNLDIIHQSTEWGKEMAMESNTAIALPYSWVDYMLRGVLVVGIAATAIPILYWTGVLQ
jgi:hypothetical protein